MTVATRRSPRLIGRLLALLLIASPTAAGSAEPRVGPPLTIARASGPIVLDGDLSDAGWQGVAGITQWFETNVGDNVEPQVKTVAYLVYDDKYLYAAFRCDDPDPKGVRAPIGDHDAVPSSTDYAGVIVDSRNDGKTAQMFLANARGVQYDAQTSDATGEDNSPDFYWEAVGKITATGWDLEIRIPFSSLRYGDAAEPSWGLLLYRNYPRDRRYQFFTARLPRDVNCFICNSSKLTGLAHLPHGSHLVVAPFATAAQSSELKGGPGSPLEAGDLKADGGLDLKWSPSSGATIDATVNPDFSQVESDAAQIAANERFALFFAEKRPFFLEGVDLLSTPMLAVYTRTVTSPRAGLRVTGKVGSTAYTALATQDRGGGQIVLPGPQGSDFAPQDFTSDVGVFRVRRDLGRSFVSMLTTARVIENGGSNLVAGPDFQWRPRAADSFTGQGLWSHSNTPTRPDLAAEWDGRELSDHAAQLSWSHYTPRVDWYLQGQDIGPEFRADNGFIPQVGYREGYAEVGYTIRPKQAFLSRVRLFTINYYDAAPDNDALNQRVSVGSGMDGRWNSFLRIELNRDNIRVGNQWLQRFRPRINLTGAPGRVLNQFSIDAYLGEEIDFANARRGTGATWLTSMSVRPGDHLELRANVNLRTLDVEVSNGYSRRLFTAQVERLRATWSFNSRTFVRLIGQYVETTRDVSLYTAAVEAKEANLSLSSLFAYKLNFQTVIYAGYGADRAFVDMTDRLEDDSRQLFAKLSYAWQQ